MGSSLQLRGSLATEPIAMDPIQVMSGLPPSATARSAVAAADFFGAGCVRAAAENDVARSGSFGARAHERMFERLVLPSNH